MTLPACCPALPTLPTSTDHCRAPHWPEPLTLHPAACPGDAEHVCLTVEDTVRLAQWIDDISEIERALSGCPLIDQVPK